MEEDYRSSYTGPEVDERLDKVVDMVASGSGHKGGLVPDTPSTAGTTKFLREDGTWNAPTCVGEPLPVVYIGEPSTPKANVIYFDTTSSKFYQRNSGNTSWVVIPTMPKALGYSSSYYEIINGVVSQTAYDWSSLWYIDYTGTWWYKVGDLCYYDYGFTSPNASWFGAVLDSTTFSNLYSSIALPTGCSTRTSLSNISTNYRMCVATISANQSTVSISGGVSSLTAGCELHVVVKATAAVTITLPTSSPYINMNADTTLSLAANTYAEINFISDGTNIYVRSIA